VSAVVQSGITVCAHIGYTPQTNGAQARVQGRDLARAMELMTIAQRLVDAGASMMVLELIPERLAGEISSCIPVPTIGIGAGRLCDGQVQVVLDIAGLSDRIYRHARAFGTVGDEYRRVVSDYAREVRGGAFPGQENVSRLDDAVYAEIHAWCEAHRRSLDGKNR
jgi:3-methyl-2-oxobutanoate hydroxymethyltransferase